MVVIQKDTNKKLQKRLNIQNIMEVPRLEKIVLNMGMGEAISNKNSIGHAQNQLSEIAGQKAIVTLAKKSVSAFKLRKGLAIGVKVTLRGRKMKAFLDKLVTVIIPRRKDFRGLKKSAVDANGNLNIGFSEQTIFPEIEFDSIDRMRGLQVTIVTTTKNMDYGRALFEEIGIPFEKEAN